MMPKVYVMCGVPGSGKTTRSKQMENEHGLERFSFDEMKQFRLLGFIEPAIKALSEGKSVILDSTNLRVNTRVKIVQHLESIPCEKVAVFMNTPLDECLRRNAHREARLIDSIVESCHRSLQAPTLSEGWDKILEVKPNESYFTGS